MIEYIKGELTELTPALATIEDACTGDDRGWRYRLRTEYLAEHL